MATLSEKLVKPFGPYSAVNFLKPRKGSRTRPMLNSVQFRQGNELVGLDIVDNKIIRNRGPILFMGNLRITAANKGCLTEDGEQRLRQDLSYRIGRMDKQYFHSPDFAVTVDICGELFLEPRELESSNVFAIVSRESLSEIEHEFTVQTLHVQSYALSRKFLSKWAVLREILSLARRYDQTPLVERTPRWLVTKYLEANLEHFNANNPDRTQTPRHVHRAEVYTMFGRHSRWLQGKITKDKLLDKNAWKRFVHEVESRWKDFNAAGPKRDPHDCDQLDELWPEEDEILPEEQAVPEDRMELDDDLYIDHDYQNTYHRVGAGQADQEQPQDEDERNEALTDPAVLAAVPKLLHSRPPPFPTNSEWCCPIDSCSYTIVLREAYKKIFEWMDEDDKEFLRSQRWGPTDGRAVELFYDIVEHHFYEHLEMAGIKHIARRYVGKDVQGRPCYEDVEIKGPRQVLPEYTGFRFEWSDTKIRFRSLS